MFKGTVSADGKTVNGHWADVPRGVTFGAGNLSLSIEEQGTPPRITLVTNMAGTTGGFRTKQFFAGIAGTLCPQNTVQLIGETQRYDKPLGENNPPCRPEQSASTELVRLSIPSPFTGATWTKLYDVVPPRVIEPPPPKPPVTSHVEPPRPGPSQPTIG